MARLELEKTNWAKAFKESAPVSYEQALEYALDPSLRVDVIPLGGRIDEMEWGITACDHNPDFLMEVCATKAQAISVCREMGWKQLR